jgi:hypothetical protein
MSALRAALAEIVGLFLDDVFLAVALLVVVVVATAASLLLHAPVAAGIILAVGCVAALVASTLRA